MPLTYQLERPLDDMQLVSVKLQVPPADGSYDLPEPSNIARTLTFYQSLALLGVKGTPDRVIFALLPVH